MANFFNQPISSSYHRVLQVDGGQIQDGSGLSVSANIDSLTAVNGFTGSLAGTASYADTAVTASYSLSASYVLGSIESSSFAITASYLSGSAETASFAQTASYLSVFATASYALTASYISGSVNVDTSSLATTGSNQFSGSQTITGSLVIGTWRLIESGSNLNVEKYIDGVGWIQSGYFEI
jgi:hypothetical protein